MNDISIVPCGDAALSLRFGEEISEKTHARVMAYARALDAVKIRGVIEYMPSYCALMVSFDPLATDYFKVKEAVLALEVSGEDAANEGSAVILPVCYGGKYGIDLPTVAKHAGLSEEEVISLHSSVDYPVYMLGFTPGFPYLGGMDARINTPRLETPRTRVEPGSVGIAGMQTGVYPVASPGGWQIIGRTPYKLYDPERKEPFLLKAGDTLRFEPISIEEYERLAKGGRL